MSRIWYRLTHSPAPLPVGLHSAWTTYWSFVTCWIDTVGVPEPTKVCKCYYAAYVRITPPHMLLRSCVLEIEYTRESGSAIYEQRRASVRFCLTHCIYGPNYIYITFRIRIDGQTRKSRSENPGAEAHRHVQLAGRRCGRSTIQRESVLRL